MVPWSLLPHLLLDQANTFSWPQHLAQASCPLLLLLFLHLQVAQAELDTNFESHLFFPTQAG